MKKLENNFIYVLYMYNDYTSNICFINKRGNNFEPFLIHA